MTARLIAWSASIAIVLGATSARAQNRGIEQEGSARVLVSAEKVPTRYSRPSGATTPQQRASVQGKPCVDCGKVEPKMVADHKTPLVKQHYEGGGIDKTKMRQTDEVQPQCPACSNKQGADLSRYSKEKLKGLKR